MAEAIIVYPRVDFCPSCGGKSVIGRGTQDGAALFNCTDCGAHFEVSGKWEVQADALCPRCNGLAWVQEIHEDDSETVACVISCGPRS